MGSVWNDCAKNVVHTEKLLDSMGFVVHPEKSVFIQTQKRDSLGFVPDSVSMLVYLTPDKALKLKHAANALFNCKNPTIREVAKVLRLVSSFQILPSFSQTLILKEVFETDVQLNEQVKCTEFDRAFCKICKLLLDRFFSFFHKT